MDMMERDRFSLHMYDHPSYEGQQLEQIII
jgi:hypothetical protein